jgi:carboxymethylenebutenolidase
LYSAHNPQLKAAVAWYGRLVGVANEFTPKHPTELTSNMMAPVLGLYGGLDTGIPLESVEAMEKALKQGSAAAKVSEIRVYDNAPHAFHADYRPSYRKEDAEDGWKQMQAWFKKSGL